MFCQIVENRQAKFLTWEALNHHPSLCKLLQCYIQDKRHQMQTQHMIPCARVKGQSMQLGRWSTPGAFRQLSVGTEGCLPWSSHLHSSFFPWEVSQQAAERESYPRVEVRKSSSFDVVSFSLVPINRGKSCEEREREGLNWFRKRRNRPSIAKLPLLVYINAVMYTLFV